MIEEIKKDAGERMAKSVETLKHDFARIRTGRANPALLQGIMVPYYGNPTPLQQVATINVEDARTLVISPWEKNLITEIERAILKSDLGITPATGGGAIRVPMPPLTEQTRRELTKQARAEAEHARVAIRNVRRDANNDVRELVKEKMATEDEARKAEEQIQKLTDRWIVEVDHALTAKESDLLEV
jgi:ribosome recycling factor